MYAMSYALSEIVILWRIIDFYMFLRNYFIVVYSGNNSTLIISYILSEIVYTYITEC